MAESDHSSEIQEETPPAQPHQTPNSPATAEIEERINPELLRAIVNGDPKGFKKILGIEDVAPNDIESIVRVANGGNSGLGGVTCGGNTVLHVVAGVMEKSSSTEKFREFMNSLNSFPISMGSTSPEAELIVIMLLYCISLLTKPLRQTFLFVYSITGIQKRIASALEMVNKCWTGTGNAQSRKKKVHDSVIHKRTTYVEIAKIIYHLDQTLLHARNNLTGETPLHCAVKAGKLEMVSLLVKFARDEGQQKLEEVLWATNQVGETALHEAARSSNSGVVEELLSADNGTSAAELLGNCVQPILTYESLLRRCREIFYESLLRRRRELFYETLLRRCHEFFYETLLRRRRRFFFEILCWEFFYESLLCRCREFFYESLPRRCREFFYENLPHRSREFLLSENRSLDLEVTNNPLANCAIFSFSNLASLVDKNGISPLYLAVAARCLHVVDMLIAPDREPSYAGPDEQTALHAAVLTQEENIMRAILEWKPALAAKTDKAQNTPLHYAALIGNTNAVKQLLLKETKSVYEANSSGSFPVHLAAEAGNFEVIKELLRTCPDVGELLDNEQRNFLHIAVEKKKIRVIILAYKEGINANMINAKDNDGNTPLHLAVINSESEIFALLCQNKRVNLHIRNDKGLTPLDLSASLRDHQFTYSLNPQSIIHRALITRGAFQNPCQPDLSKTVNNFWKARAVRLNQREGKEMLNGVEVDIEKESTKYENMSKSLITGAVLIASATFVSIFTVSGVYRGDNTPHTLWRRNFFKAFIIVNIAAFTCAIVSTIWLLYSALSNFHLKYRKFYFKWCTKLLYLAINLFILTFGLGGYIAIAPLSEWLALLILAISGIVILWNIIWNPSFVPLILLAPYMSNEYQ